MATYNTSASTSIAIRPEFQLCQITNPQGYLNKQTNIFLPAGTIYARLYFPKGCCPIGSTIKGIVAYDSRKNQLTRGNEQFELLIVCSDVKQYRKLYIMCGKSNILFNRRRTDNLMKDLNNNGIGTRHVPIPVDAPEPVETELVASPDHIQSTPEAAVIPTNIELEFVKKYQPRTLRRILNNFGILYSGIKDNEIKQYTYDQLVARGISAVAVKQCFRNPKF